MKKIHIIAALITIFVLRGSYGLFFENKESAETPGTISHKISTTAVVDTAAEPAPQDAVTQSDIKTISESIRPEIDVAAATLPEFYNQSPAATTRNAATRPAKLLQQENFINNPHGIILQNYSFDTSTGEPDIPENLRLSPENINQLASLRYLVQFAGPVEDSWKDAITDAGADVGEYVPNNAFVIDMTAAERDAVSLFPFVQWIGYYHPAFKVSGDLVGNSGKVVYRPSPVIDETISDAPLNGPGSSSALPSSEPSATSDQIGAMDDSTANGYALLTVQSFNNGRLPHLNALIDQTGTGTVIDSSDTRKSRIRVSIAPEELQRAVENMAQDPEVAWIEPYVPPTLHNDKMHWVVQSNISGSNPLWENGLTGAGQVVGVGDTGLDADMAFFWDSSQGLPGSSVNQNQRKVLSYHDLAGNGDWDGHDHGTHVAGTIAGKSLGTNSGYNGVAYDAKLVIQDIGNGGSLTGIPNDLNTYFQQAYDDGARIHSNSWGAAVNGAYTTSSQDADEFMWNHKDFFIVFSAGNSGPDTGTVGSPGTAKNILTSGASQNAQSGYNPENMAYFSSNGPTADGRIKPTISAPGYYIMSADNDGNINSYNSGVRSMSGTSMSAPSHAGSATLVRQYFTDGFYPSGSANADDSFIPSAALIKATMVNSGVDMTGSYTDGSFPSTGQGWGRILLDNTLLFQGDAHLLYVADETTGLSTSEFKSYSFYANGTEPVKVTLCWTDYYPSLSAAVKLVNDLDLQLIGPGGTYLGNVFTSGVSVTGGSADRLNVEENIYLPTPPEGVYTIVVKAHNVPNGPQPYALVATGLQSGSSAGIVSFDRAFYNSDSEVIIAVNDLDLDTTGGLDTVQVHLSATNDAGQDILLTELAASPGTFAIMVTLDSILSTAEGDTVTVTYVDANDGSGNSVTLTDTAVIDNTPPVISGVSTSGISDTSATITWTTNESAVSSLLYRELGTTDWTVVLSNSDQSHTATIDTLQHTTTYEFYIVAADQAANTVSDDNNGSFYTFSTDVEEVVWSDTADEGSSLFTLTGGSNSSGENGLWHITTSRYNSPGTAWYYGQESTSNYDTGYHNWGHITTAEGIALQGVSNAYLSFRHILETEGYTSYDTARVQISTDNSTFTTVYESIESSSDWEEIQVDLSAYIGQTVWIRFSFDSVDSYFNDYLGWVVDDIQILTFNPDDGVPPAMPSGLTIDDPGDDTITLAWDANTESDFKEYNIYRDSILIDTVASATSYTDTTATHGVDYSYSISAVDRSNRESDPTEVLSATAGTPDTPAGFTALGADTQIQLSWTPNSEADLEGYNVYTFSDITYPDDLALSSAGAQVITSISGGTKAALLNGITNDGKITRKRWPGDIIIDLGQTVLVERIGLHNYDGDSRFQRYTVSISADNSDYQLVADRSKGRHRGYKEDNITPTPARYIKVRVLYNSKGPNVVFREARVYGKPLEKINDTIIDDSTQFTVTDLVNGDDYWFAVNAVDIFGNSSTVSELEVSAPDDGIPPAIPSDFVIDDPGDDSITLSWTPNSETDLRKYNIYRDELLIDTIDAASTTYNDTDTVHGVDYSYSITAVDRSNMESDPTALLSATAGTPEPPVGLAAMGADTQVQLSWTPNSEPDLEGYNVYTFSELTYPGDLALSSAGAKVISSISGGSKAALLNGVTNDGKITRKKWPGDIVIDLGQTVLVEKIGLHNYDGDSRFQRYTVSVSADNSDYQLVVDRSRGRHKGYKEDTITPTPARYIKVRVLYNSKGTNVVFREARVYGKPLEKINETIIEDTTQFTVTDLINGQDYWFGVNAVDIFGNSSAVSQLEVSAPDDGIPPAAPADLVIEDPGDDSISLSWTPNSETDLRKYNIYRDGLLIDTVDSSITSYSDTTTVHGVDYSYSITAVDRSNMESDPTEMVSATAGTPEPPVGISVLGSETQAQLSWTPNSEADLAGYNVYRFSEITYPGDLALSSAGAQVISSISRGSKAALLNGKTNDGKITGKKWPGNIIIDLGKTIMVERIGLHNYDGDTRFQRYTVSVSTDNSNYQLVVNRSTGRHRGYKEDTITPTPARYIKVRVLYNSKGSNVVFREATVYGKTLEKVNGTILEDTSPFTITNLTNGQGYWFGVSAVDIFGNESGINLVSHNNVNSVDSIDSDNDGIPDSWERLHGLDPNDPTDANLDRDGDGISNLEEYLSEALSDTDETTTVSIDSDNDGLTDADEMNLYGTDPYNWDSDGDGISDGEEIANGTDPLVYSPLHSSPDPAFGYFTWTLPPEASSTRLMLPAAPDNFVFTEESGIVSYGLHSVDNPEGYDHIWIDLQGNAPVLSWADGIITDIQPDPNGGFLVFVEYADGLYGIHGSIAESLLAAGDTLAAGQPVGYGTETGTGTEVSSFSLVDLGRSDGIESPFGGVNVSPFDYLNIQQKEILIDLYKTEVIDRYLASPATPVWGFDPAQPYLTNAINLHQGKTGFISGVWLKPVLSGASESTKENVYTFLEAETPYFQGNLVFVREYDVLNDKFVSREGAFEIDYALGRIEITFSDGEVVYGLFAIDESGSQPVMILEIQTGDYPAEFTGESSVYTLQ